MSNTTLRNLAEVIANHSQDVELCDLEPDEAKTVRHAFNLMGAIEIARIIAEYVEAEKFKVATRITRGESVDDLICDTLFRSLKESEHWAAAVKIAEEQDNDN